MGWGDEIMVTGEAVRLGCSAANPLVVIGRDGKPRWHALWNHNPRIYKPGTVLKGDHKIRQIRNHPGWRPYVVYASPEYRKGIANQPDDLTVTNKAKWFYHPTWRGTPGELHLGRREPQGYVVVEPHGKRGLSGNKDWPWSKWQALVDLLLADNVYVVQLGPPGTRILDGPEHIPTHSFESSCVALSGAYGAILPEGGLHHAAAALGIRAVVLFGGSTSPLNTGYALHTNISEGEPCGQRQSCNHCRDVWQRLTPEHVVESYHQGIVKWD